MDVREAVAAVMREYLLPELEALKAGQARADVEFTAINKRLDDINAHLVEQGRRIDTTNERIDAVRDGLEQRIDAVREELGQRIDETNKRIDAMREELGQRIDETNKRIDAMREELGQRIDETNKRIDRLSEVIVRRDEHSTLVIKVNALENDVREIKQRLAA